MEAETSSNQRPVIQASEILAKIERGEDVEYDGVIVEGDLDISELDLPMEHVDRTELEKNLGLSEVLRAVYSQITITNSEIHGKVNFSNALFKEPINFSGAEFGGNANLMGVEFDGEANFWYAKFGGKAHFFGLAKFGRDANFWHAKFDGDVHFWDAKFGGNANFMGVELGGEADFRDAKFGGNANFGEAKFGGNARFWYAKFAGEAHFMGAEFGEEVNFMVSRFGGVADFRETKFGGNANFMVAGFGGDAHFWYAKFGGDANFRKVSFDGDSNFIVARFDGDADFRDATFDNILILDDFKCERLYITWDSINDKLVYSGPAYLALIKNFKVIEQFGEADDCEYQYRKESQNHKTLYDKENGWDLSKFIDIISWISCGYGVRPLHTVFSMFGVVFIASIIFLGYFDSMFESFYFSLMTFTGGLMMFTGGEPDILTPDRWLRTLAMIEAILGYLLMALFVVVLARKFIR